MTKEEMLQRNREVLRKRFPEVDAVLDRESSCELVLEGEGVYGLSIVKDGKKRTLHSRYRPLEEARTAVANQLAQKNEKDGHILVYGFGLGYHVEEILRQAKDLKQILVLESEPALLRLALSIRDWTELLSDERLRIGIPFEPKAYYDKLIDQFLNDSVLFFHLYDFLPYQRVFGDRYDLFLEKLRDRAGKTRINQNTLLFFAKKWMENIIRNAPDLIQSPGINRFFDRFVDCPGVVVSAGPSLDKNIDLLARLKEKAVIIAVGTALKALLARGIEPDFVITADGGEPNLRHFEGLDYKGPLIFIPTSHYVILEKHRGPKVAVSRGMSLAEWIARYGEDKGGIEYSGSVATAALDSLKRMGCNPLIFVGQDLSYPEGKSHASGTNYGLLTKDEHSPFTVYVDGYAGGKVLSDKVLQSFLMWFEAYIARTPDRTFINATEGGARIAGAEPMLLQKVLEEYCVEDRNVSQRIREILEAYTPPDYSQLAQALETQREELGKLRRTARDAEKASKKLFDIYQKGVGFDKVNKLLKKLDDLDVKIKELNQERLLDMPMQQTLLAVTHGNLATESQGETEREMGKRIAENSQILYANLANEAKVMAKLFDEVLEKIRNGSDLQKECSG